jgi:tetratricopeptide (TPR) repeat protein
MYLEKKESIQELSKVLNEIRKIDPDNVAFLKLSAGYSLLLKDYTNAIFFANRAMLANPFDDEILYLRGSAMLINRDSISALNSYEEAYKLKESYKNFSKIFELSIALGNHILAKNYLDEFESETQTAQLCYEKGVYFHEIGEPDTAKFLLKNCLTKSNNDSRIYLELSKIYFEENALDSSRQVINQYLNLKPNEGEGYVLKARIMERFNNFTDAKELYLAALEIDSTYTLASSGLENLERKVAYLQLVKRKEIVQRQVESLKPLNSKQIN